VGRIDEQQEKIAKMLDAPAAAEAPMTDFDDSIDDDPTTPSIHGGRADSSASDDSSLE
jgi:hypothetical protein